VLMFGEFRKERPTRVATLVGRLAIGSRPP
jgi:hypothetical protein